MGGGSERGRSNRKSTSFCFLKSFWLSCLEKHIDAFILLSEFSFIVKYFKHTEKLGGLCNKYVSTYTC